MANATKTTELYVTTTNEVGALAKCTLSLREKGININAMNAYAKDQKTGVFHFVTTDNTQAKQLLTQNGYNVTENEVVCWTANNNPGELNRGTSALAEKQVNINYTYGTAGQGNTASWIVFNTNNNDNAYETLNNL